MSEQHAQVQARRVRKCWPRCSCSAASSPLRPGLPPSLPQVNEKDAEVLSYCTDVRCERFHDDETGDEVGRGWASVSRSWHAPGLSGLFTVCRNRLCAFQLFNPWLP